MLFCESTGTPWVPMSSLWGTNCDTCWNEDATSKIYYADSPITNFAEALSQSDGILISSHGFNLTGLASSTKYYYIVTAADEASNNATSSEEVFDTL